jgi:hypothetical protein
VRPITTSHDGYDRGSGNGPERSKDKEDLMKQVLMGLAALPFIAGVATAGQTLTDQQLDRVTAGFTASSIADAQGVVGESGLLFTSGSTLAEVAPFATRSVIVGTPAGPVAGEISSTLFKSVAAAQSASLTSTVTPAPIPGLSGPIGP